MVEDNEDEEDKWAVHLQAWGQRYFEKQRDARCGQHVLNNIVGGPVYTDQDMDVACAQVCEATGDQPGDHKAPGGWFSHSVLGQAFENQVPPTMRLLSRRASSDEWKSLMENPEYQGTVINMANQHWTAIVKHNGLVFYVDSCRAPQFIDEADYLSLIKARPDTYFVVDAASDAV